MSRDFVKPILFYST